MQTGKERYEERRQQEHDNEMARLRMQKARYEAEEAAEILVAALRAFVEGSARLVVAENYGASGGSRVVFEWPGKPTADRTAASPGKPPS